MKFSGKFLSVHYGHDENCQQLKVIDCYENKDTDMILKQANCKFSLVIIVLENI